MILDRPRVVLSALKGDAGKTFLTMGVGACLGQSGRAVVPFKKGPDYIDAAWLKMAFGRPCYNLDLFLMGRDSLLSSFARRVAHGDGALIEGNRGLYDGMDRQGSYSTAELAKLLQAPVVMVVDCSMASRTVAATVLGCQRFDPEVPIRGVILNRVAGSRHEAAIRTAVEAYCGLPVLGAVPRIREGIFPERHMGLVPPEEHPGALPALEETALIVSRCVDVERLWEIAGQAPVIHFPGEGAGAAGDLPPGRPLRIGVVRDSAFWFYYPDNLEALEALGASLVECSALTDRALPEVDALYIGGGFPETHAAALSANAPFRRAVQEAATQGLPIYAECGGLMYLGKELRTGDGTFPMAGVFPLSFVLDKRPQGHGYTVLEADRANPYFAVGEVLHGHEFHYSRLAEGQEGEGGSAFRVKRGHGIQGGRDGLCYKNVLAAYSHLHAAGAGGWAKALCKQAVAYQRNRQAPESDVGSLGINDIDRGSSNRGFQGPVSGPSLRSQ